MINEKNPPKYPRYQDYVIKNGKLIGEFERMYQDHEDPWYQSQIEEYASDKAITINLIRKLKVKKVIELGCGLGNFTKKISDNNVKVLGVDISKTAIKKAKENFPKCSFRVGDILEFDIYRDFKPDLIIMAEITWYILNKLDYFLSFIKRELPITYLIHLLATYPPDVQQYGNEKFTNLNEIMSYFGMNYLEWGEIHSSDNDCIKTYFLGKWK